MLALGQMRCFHALQPETRLAEAWEPSLGLGRELVPDDPEVRAGNAVD